MAAGDRIIITLACTECKNRNYHFARGKKKEGKLEASKFCSTCGKHTPHKETK
jgi:large subunit ribosomal protein L33